MLVHLCFVLYCVLHYVLTVHLSSDSSYYVINLLGSMPDPTHQMNYCECFYSIAHIILLYYSWVQQYTITLRHMISMKVSRSCGRDWQTLGLCRTLSFKLSHPRCWELCVRSRKGNTMHFLQTKNSTLLMLHFCMCESLLLTPESAKMMQRCLLLGEYCE